MKRSKPLISEAECWANLRDVLLLMAEIMRPAPKASRKSKAPAKRKPTRKPRR